MFTTMLTTTETITEETWSALLRSPALAALAHRIAEACNGRSMTSSCAEGGEVGNVIVEAWYHPRRGTIVRLHSPWGSTDGLTWSKESAAALEVMELATKPAL
jgi:hypothetical protein